MGMGGVWALRAYMSSANMAQAGSTVLVFSVASWFIISRLWVTIMILFQVKLMRKTSSDHYCSIVSNVHQNNGKLLNNLHQLPVKYPNFRYS